MARILLRALLRPLHLPPGVENGPAPSVVLGKAVVLLVGGKVVTSVVGGKLVVVIVGGKFVAVDVGGKVDVVVVSDKVAVAVVWGKGAAVDDGNVVSAEVGGRDVVVEAGGEAIVAEVECKGTVEATRGKPVAVAFGDISVVVVAVGEKRLVEKGVAVAVRDKFEGLGSVGVQDLLGMVGENFAEVVVLGNKDPGVVVRGAVVVLLFGGIFAGGFVPWKSTAVVVDFSVVAGGKVVVLVLDGAVQPIFALVDVMEVLVGEFVVAFVTREFVSFVGGGLVTLVHFFAALQCSPLLHVHFPRTHDNPVLQRLLTLQCSPHFLFGTTHRCRQHFPPLEH